MEPAEYEAWYHTPRGAWIGDTEFRLMMRLMRPPAGASLVDVGCGTGYFSRRFAGAGLRVSAVDPDPRALEYARDLGGGVQYQFGQGGALPFPDLSRDYCAAVTSLCFVAEPLPVLEEMWRVARRGLLLGLLNRRSLLNREKHGSGGYRGARWDDPAAARDWFRGRSGVAALHRRTAVFLPGGGPVARGVERLVPGWLPWGAFIAVYVEKK